MKSVSEEEHARRHGTQDHAMAADKVTRPMLMCFMLYDNLFERELEAEEQGEPVNVCSQCLLSGLIMSAAINAMVRVSEKDREVFLDYVIEDLKSKALRTVTEFEVDADGGGRA